MKKVILKYLFCKYEIFLEKYFRKNQLEFISGIPTEQEPIFSTRVIGIGEAQKYIEKLEKFPENIHEICLLRPRSKKIIALWYRTSQGFKRCS